MRFNKLSTGLIAVMAAFALNSAQAAEVGGAPLASGYVGLLGGVGITTGAPVSTSYFEYGLHIGYHFMPEMSVGVFGQTFSSADTNNGFFTIKGARAWMFGAEANYHFIQLPGLHAGVKLGAATSDATNSTTDFIVGPLVAYDIQITDGFSIGPSVEYLFDTSSSTGNVLSALADIKFHF